MPVDAYSKNIEGQASGPRAEVVLVALAPYRAAPVLVVGLRPFLVTPSSGNYRTSAGH